MSLTRRTPLRRTPLARTSQPLRTTRLRPVSEVRRQRATDRERVRETVIERDGGCAARDLLPGACWGRLDPHEPHPHADLLDPDHVLCLCRRHHTGQFESAHLSPQRYELGLLCHFYEPLWSWEADWKDKR